MVREKNQGKANDQKTTEHVKSYTMPKPPARVRPRSIPSKPVQPDTKPDNKPESPEPESPKPKN